MRRPCESQPKDPVPVPVPVMPTLPDEMVAEVLSWLPPETLLGPAAVVCKRWHAVSKTRLAWRRAALHSRVDVATLRRVLRLAPALGFLDARMLVEAPRGGARSQSLAATADALLSCTVHIERLELGIWGNSDAWFCLLIKLLRRFAPHLRHLAVGLAEAAKDYTEVDEHGGVSSVYGTIAGLQLTSLKLFCAIYRSPAYRQELGRGPGLRNLRHLTIASKRSNFWLGDNGASPAIDVLAAKADRLYSLKVNVVGEPYPDDLVHAIRSCSRLRSVHLPIPYLRLLDEMVLPDLEHVGVLLHGTEVGPVEGDADLLAAVLASRTLRNVSKLDIVGYRYCGWGEGFIAQVIAALGEVCANVKVLGLKADRAGFWTNGMFLLNCASGLKSLEELHLKGGFLCGVLFANVYLDTPTARHLDVTRLVRHITNTSHFNVNAPNQNPSASASAPGAGDRDVLGEHIQVLLNKHPNITVIGYP